MFAAVRARSCPPRESFYRAAHSELETPDQHPEMGTGTGHGLTVKLRGDPQQGRRWRFVPLTRTRAERLKGGSVMASGARKAAPVR